MLGDVVEYLQGSAVTGKGTATGGYGHLGLVGGAASPVSPEYFELLGPSVSTLAPGQLMQMPILESCRDNPTPIAAVNVIHDGQGKLTLIAEFESDGTLCILEDPLLLRLWRPPPPLSDLCKRSGVGAMQVYGAVQSSAAWSWSTAVGSWWHAGYPITASTTTIIAAWDNAPICSSLPIKFWQMLMHATGNTEAMARWFPRPCDTCLPADVITLLQSTGWQPSIMNNQMPQPSIMNNQMPQPSIVNNQMPQVGTQLVANGHERTAHREQPVAVAGVNRSIGKRRRAAAARAKLVAELRSELSYRPIAAAGRPSLCVAQNNPITLAEVTDRARKALKQPVGINRAMDILREASGRQ